MQSPMTSVIWSSEEKKSNRNAEEFRDGLFGYSVEDKQPFRFWTMYWTFNISYLY